MQTQAFNFIPEDAYTADFNGGQFESTEISMLAVGVSITAKSGTTPKLTCWLEASLDGGDTWFQVPYDQRIKASASATDVTAGTNKRNIADEETDVAAIIAIYKHVPHDLLRINCLISGTTPSFTFEVSAIGK